jgi:hypothetical protein
MNGLSTVHLARTLRLPRRASLVHRPATLRGVGGFVPELGGHVAASSIASAFEIASSRIYNAEGCGLLEGEEDSDRKGG